MCLKTFRFASPQGEEAKGDTGDGAAAWQEHEQPAHMAVSHRGGAGQAGCLQRVPQRRDPEEAGRAAGGQRLSQPHFNQSNNCLPNIIVMKTVQVKATDSPVHALTIRDVRHTLRCKWTKHQNRKKWTDEPKYIIQVQTCDHKKQDTEDTRATFSLSSELCFWFCFWSTEIWLRIVKYYENF